MVKAQERLRILVVDDDSGWLRSVVDYLNDNGCPALGTADLNEADHLIESGGGFTHTLWDKGILGAHDPESNRMLGMVLDNIDPFGGLVHARKAYDLGLMVGIVTGEDLPVPGGELDKAVKEAGVSVFFTKESLADSLTGWVLDGEVSAPDRFLPAWKIYGRRRSSRKREGD